MADFCPLTLDVKHRFLTTYSTRARARCCLYFLLQMNNVDVNQQYFKHLHEVEHLHEIQLLCFLTMKEAAALLFVIEARISS